MALLFQATVVAASVPVDMLRVFTVRYTGQEPL